MSGNDSEGYYGDIEEESDESGGESEGEGEDGINVGEVIQRTLYHKSGFDDMTRFNFNEYEEIEPKVCQPFDPNIVVANPNEILEFQRIPEFLDEDFQTIFSSRIVGWMDTTSGKMILASTKVWTPDLGSILPLTDTIFPVCVIGVNENPIEGLFIDRGQFKTYDPGMYLALRGQPKTLSRDLKITIEPLNQTYLVASHRANLKKYVIYKENDEKKVYTTTTFNQIVDRLNEEYGVFGLYAGGPLPPPDVTTGKPRLCWDQRRTQTMSVSFRCDVEFQMGESRRIGIICSRDALLEVREKVALPKGSRRQYTSFNSLLKESSFTTCDGNIYYRINSGPKFGPRQRFKDAFFSKLVVAPEGLSALNIHTKEYNSTFRNSVYWLENSAKSPLYITWKDFQQDFSDFQPFSEFVTAFEGLSDYKVYDIDDPPIKTDLMFCLAESKNTEGFFRDTIHVYGSLADQDTGQVSANYCYLATIQNAFEVQQYFGKRSLVYKRTYRQNRLFSLTDLQNRFPEHLSHSERNIAVQLLIRFDQMLGEVQRHRPLRIRFNWFANYGELQHQSKIGENRNRIINSLLKDEGIPTRVQNYDEIMKEIEFKDFRDYSIKDPPLITELIFCLDEENLFFVDEHDEYKEAIHVYGSLSDKRTGKQSVYYYYLYTVQNTFKYNYSQFNRKVWLNYYKTNVRHRERLYPNTGLQHRYPHLSESEVNIAEDLLKDFLECAYNLKEHRLLRSLFRLFATGYHLRGQTDFGKERDDFIRDLLS